MYPIAFSKFHFLLFHFKSLLKVFIEGLTTELYNFYADGCDYSAINPITERALTDLLGFLLG
jgi:hypothetical protein